MVRCRPTGSEKNTRTTGHDSGLSLVEITFWIKPEAAPLFRLCISVLARLQRTGEKCLSQLCSVSLSIYSLCNNSSTAEWVFSITILDIYQIL
jgi:hypothetical protein